jgi:ribonuclease BN (tRNA processing enzyme)
MEGVSLAADLVVHPGPTVGFRIETESARFAYIPDHEPALVGIDGRSIDWISGAALAEGVDLLFHDAQYLEEEYETRIGWGHSSVSDAVAFGRAVRARRLLLFHHEPRHSDESLERLEARAQSLAGSDGLQPALAREGMVIELP